MGFVFLFIQRRVVFSWNLLTCFTVDENSTVFSIILHAIMPIPIKLSQLFACRQKKSLFFNCFTSFYFISYYFNSLALSMFHLSLCSVFSFQFRWKIILIQHNKACLQRVGSLLFHADYIGVLLWSNRMWNISIWRKSLLTKVFVWKKKHNHNRCKWNEK